MNNKTSRPLSKSLRVMIAAGSIGAFLGGWALLAHAPNPYENVQAAPAQNSRNNSQLPALPTPRAQTAPNLQTRPQPLQPNTQSLPQQQFGSPFRQSRMRTGGS